MDEEIRFIVYEIKKYAVMLLSMEDVMHSGSIVLIDKKEFILEKSLFSPLSIHNGTTIYGLYYPAEHSKVDKRFTVEHDFMFTPVPPRLWYAVASFFILVKNEPGHIEHIAEYLSNNGVNILTAESTRAAHRYISIALTVSFEALSDKNDSILKNTINTDDQIVKKQRKLRRLINKTKQGLEIDCADYLFTDKYHSEPYGEIKCDIVNSLQYFYGKVSTYSQDRRYVPFRASVINNRIIFKDDDWGLFSEIFGDDIPTYGFALTSTKDINIRIAVIPNKSLHTFSFARIDYKSVPSNLQKYAQVTTKGLYKKIAEIFCSHKYNIWRLYNSSTLNDVTIEEGYFKIVAQAMDDSCNIDNVLKDVELHFHNETRHDKHIHISNTYGHIIRRYPIFVSVRKGDKNINIYKDKLFKIGKEYGLLDTDFVLVDHPDDYVIENVIRKIKTCKAVIQIHNKDNDGTLNPSIWLEAEYLLAKSLKLPIAQIVHNELKSNLKVSEGFHATVIQEEVSDADIRFAFNFVTQYKDNHIPILLSEGAL